VAYMEENSTYSVLVSKSEGKRPHGVSRHRWEDNVRKGLKRNWNDVHGVS
jgi:hypothetical protein